MSDLASAFHAGQEAALRASAALQSAMGGKVNLFATVPVNAKSPYIKHGEDSVLVIRGACGDEGEIFATVSIWTRPNPPQAQEARALAGIVIDVLDAAFAVAGHEIVTHELESADYSTQPDHSTFARLVFRYETTEVVAP